MRYNVIGLLVQYFHHRESFMNKETQNKICYYDNHRNWVYIVNLALCLVYIVLLFVGHFVRNNIYNSVVTIIVVSILIAELILFLIKSVEYKKQITIGYDDQIVYRNKLNPKYIRRLLLVLNIISAVLCVGYLTYTLVMIGNAVDIAVLMLVIYALFMLLTGYIVESVVSWKAINSKTTYKSTRLKNIDKSLLMVMVLISTIANVYIMQLENQNHGLALLIILSVLLVIRFVVYAVIVIFFNNYQAYLINEQQKEFKLK